MHYLSLQCIYIYIKVKQVYKWIPFLGVASLLRHLRIRKPSCCRAARGQRNAPVCVHEEHDAWEEVSIKQPRQAYNLCKFFFVVVLFFRSTQNV